MPLETICSQIIEQNGKKVGLIEITSFLEGNVSRFRSNIKSFEKEGIVGLVIDVRGNPGGYL
ncbi:hypothetical protein KHA80_13470 [Anaerobacillus sp. HL2]|nr:hypothetical protein KHA80_13470 [Anaerobacillus sp. HL2]